MHSHKLIYDDPISVFSPLLQFYFKSFIPACVLQKSGVEPRLLVILSLKPSFCILFMHSLTTMRWVLKGLIMFVVGKFETQHITVNTCLSSKYEFAVLECKLEFWLGCSLVLDNAGVNLDFVKNVFKRYRAQNFRVFFILTLRT